MLIFCFVKNFKFFDISYNFLFKFFQIFLHLFQLNFLFIILIKCNRSIAVSFVTKLTICVKGSILIQKTTVFIRYFVLIINYFNNLEMTSIPGSLPYMLGLQLYHQNNLKLLLQHRWVFQMILPYTKNNLQQNRLFLNFGAIWLKKIKLQKLKIKISL